MHVCVRVCACVLVKERERERTRTTETNWVFWYVVTDTCQQGIRNNLINRGTFLILFFTFDQQTFTSVMRSAVRSRPSYWAFCLSYFVYLINLHNCGSHFIRCFKHLYILYILGYIYISIYLFLNHIFGLTTDINILK